MSEKMNVLFIITDALRADDLGCYGNTLVKTPNIDRLASESVRFTNYFCTNPICMPNRATMLTGLYPNVHGVRSNGMILDQDIPRITDVLRKSGWHTASIGKIHHQFWIAPYKRKIKSAEDIVSWAVNKGVNEPVREKFPLPYYGYEEVELVAGNGTICAGHYSDWLEEKSPEIAEKVKQWAINYDNLFSLFCEEIPEELYNTTYVKERTIAFLEKHSRGEKGEKPFYLNCSFPDPHYPVYPPKSFLDMYKPEDIELPSNFNDAKNLYNHEYLGPHLKNPPFKRAFLRETTEEEARKFIAFSHASISYVDHCVGQILATLEKTRYSENTIVIFTSDHGDLMGDHGLLFKGPCPFNGVLHIPLICKIPGLTNPGVSKSLVSSIDYPKTMLNVLGIREKRHPPNMQGYDITPILKNPEEKVRDCCFIENDEEVGPLKSRLRHLITEDFKLTVYEGLNNYGDIYDRKKDPAELNNLWYDDSFTEKRFELVNKLMHEQLKAQSRYPERIAGS